jgi:hypothetical protein
MDLLTTEFRKSMHPETVAELKAMFKAMFKGKQWVRITTAPIKLSNYKNVVIKFFGSEIGRSCNGDQFRQSIADFRVLCETSKRVVA